MPSDKKTGIPENPPRKITTSPTLKAPQKKDISAWITSFIEILSKFTSLVTWPVVVLLFLVIFYPSVKQMVELLPAKFAGSSEISVAGILSLKIQDAAEASGNAELASIINGLTEEEIKRLISLGRGPLRLVGSNSNLSGTLDSYVIPLTDYSIWKSLEARGLVQSTQDLNDYEGFFYSLNPTKGYSNTLRIPVSDLTKEQTDKLLDNDVELTDLGYKAYNIIIKIIADSIGIK